MRIICLHGCGTSGHILDVQTSMLRANLDMEAHQFDFIDAPYPWQAGPGVELFFEGPYYAWWKTPTTVDVKDATQALLERLRGNDPPYDAVLCFSQGCGILSSLILYHQTELPKQPLPFRAAIFICGGGTLPIIEGWLPISEKARSIAEHNERQLHAISADVPKKLERLLASGTQQGIWDRPTSIWDGSNDNGEKGPSWGMPLLDPADVYGLDIGSLPANLRISIPTIHIYGHKDPLCTSSLQLAMMCDPEQQVVYDHGGGHEIPRSTRVSKDIADALQWLEKHLA